MAKLSEKSVTVGGIQATGRGVRGEVTLGAQASARARDGGAFDPLEAVLRADDTLELRADVTIDIQAAESRRGRGAAAALPFDETPAVRLDGPDLGPREAGQIAIVEEDGYYRFVLPNPGTANQFDLLIGHVGAEGDRGFLGKIGQMAVRIVGVVVAKKAIAKVTDLLVRKVEDTTRPHALRPFGPKDYSSKTHKPVDFQQLASGPSLLLIHGTNSSTHGCFGFTQPYVNELNDRYGNRVFAFDHPSLAYSPMENALWMNKQLQKAGARLDEVDIIAHSRGGLVARSLVEQVRSELLGVRSVLFVATPNAGTHLADADHLADFITVTTNLLTVMPDNVVTDAITVGLEVLKDYVLGAAFKAIKGVAVMNPNSDVLAELNTLRPPSGVKYRAIAANYEPRSDHGVKQRARDLAMDLIFTGIDNDLVVPTRSAYSPTGAFRVGAGDRLVLDSSYGVNHSTFWRDDEAMKRFDQWLDPAIDVDAADPVPAEYTDPEAEYEAALTTGDLVGLRRVTSALSGEQLRVVAQRVGGAIAVPLRSEVPTEGSVIVLPGIMGSRLAVDGREVWANPWQLFRGRFAHLEVDDGKREVKPAGLMKQYVPLVSHLDRRWGVFPMAYDWRRDIQEAAAQLAELIQDDRVGLGKRGKSVHIVAHSMGGLVARAFIAQYPDLWDRAAGRLIQLGTPNWGSFAIPSAFLGEEFLVKALAFADVFHSEEEIVETLATFPGVYQMLPSPDRTLPDGNNDHAKIYREEVWEPWPINQDLLNDARAFQEGIKDAIDPKRFIYIAGDGHRTPYRLRVEASGSISLGVTQRGDGRVPHDFGYGGLDVPTYFVEAKHGDLSSASEVLDVLDELLESGKTDRLATESAIRGERADHELEWVPVEDLEFALGRTTNFATRSASGPKRDQAKSAIAEATKLYLGGDGDVAPRTRPLRVQVVHGSLEQAKYPVAVGWYKGLSIEGALWFADWRLDGALRRRIDRGLGPEEAGSAIYVAAAEGDQPVGAIVLGLGEFGDLTPTRVTEAVANGTMEYVLDQLQHTSGKPTLGVSAVLVGAPGRYGLGVENSVLALIAGVSQAAEELADLAFIDELEIIEYYEGFAEHAAATLQRIADPSFAETFAVPIDVRPTLQTRPGGRPGIGEPQESGAAWPRLELEFVDPDESTKTASADGVAAAASKAAGPVDATPVEEARPLPRELKYVGLTNRAQAEHLVVPVDTDSLHRLVQVAVNDPYADAQTKNTLYELLFPNQAKLQLDELDNLHLLVDETTAWIPWEVLAGRDTSGQLQPLALRTGLLRQLKPRLSGVRLRMPAPAGRHAFIVGDPPAGSRFPRLAGARREAEQVAEILKGNDPNGRFTVNSRIYGPGTEQDSRQAAEIRNDFFAQPYRVIHVAAHGVFDDESGNPLASGAVIGAVRPVERPRLQTTADNARPCIPQLLPHRADR